MLYDALIVKNNCSILNAAPYLIAPEPKKYDANISADAVSGCRHNGGSNFTFADGHAKFYKFGQGPTEKNANYKGDAWGWKDPWWDYSCQ